MEIIDISWPISTATTGYKDKDVVNFEKVKTFAQDEVRENNVTLSTHTGTHVDAPAHFMRDGKTIDQVEPQRLIGKCIVVDTTICPEKITIEELQTINIPENSFVLLKTTNSDKSPTEKFSPHFVYLHESGARYLAEKNVQGVGIDYLGIERSQPDHVTHLELMKHDITIIEGLRLQHVDPGEYFFVCLPLYLVGLEAAPARAVLIKNM